MRQQVARRRGGDEAVNRGALLTALGACRDAIVREMPSMKPMGPVYHVASGVLAAIDADDRGRGERPLNDLKHDQCRRCRGFSFGARPRGKSNFNRHMIRAAFDRAHAVRVRTSLASHEQHRSRGLGTHEGNSMKLSGKMLVAAATILTAPVAQAQVLGGKGVGGVVGGVVGSAGGAVSGAVGGAGAISGVGGATGSGQGTGMFGATFGHGGIGSTVRDVASNREGIGGGRAWGTFEETPKTGRRGKSFGERFSEVSEGVVLGRTIPLGQSPSATETRGSGKAQGRAPQPKASATARSNQTLSKRGANSSKSAHADVETRRVRASASGETQVQANR